MGRGVNPRTLSVGLGAAVREFAREPVNVGLLVALPPLVVTSYGSMLESLPKLPYMATDPGTMGAMAGTLFVAAFLPGVIGLFQVISARRADDRLALAGFPRSALFGSRLLAVCVASLLTATISLTVLTFETDVTALLPAFLVLAFVGVLYGLLGMLIGSVLPRELEGSLVLIFLVDMDEALASGIVATESDLPKLFPLHYPHDLFRAAVTGDAAAVGDVVAAAVYGVAVLGIVLLVYAAVTGDGGGLA